MEIEVRYNKDSTVMRIKKKGGTKMFSEVFGETMEGNYEINLRE